jgi:membrane protease subunit HflK
MLLVGIPIYTCASASTPIAAALVLKGLDPGAALVFLLAGPATNIAAVIVLLKVLGRRVVAIYLATIAVVSVLAGYALNWIFERWQLDPVATIGSGAGLVSEPVKVAGAVVLIGLLLVSLWRTAIPREWIQVRDWIGAFTGIRVTARGLKVATGALIVLLYLASGLFTVGVGEVGLATRFGRLAGPPLGPGLHLRWPWPIGEHRVIQRDRVRRIEVGFRSAGRDLPVEERGFGKQGLTLVGPGFPVPPAGAVSFWFQKEKVVNESFLLTGDENIVDVAFTAQYRVEDPVAYTYGVADPEVVVRSVTIAALRAAVATMTVDSLYTTSRRTVEQAVERAAQEVLDGYGIGVRLTGVNLLSVHAPDEVHAAFRDVASAQEDKILITDRATTFAQEAVNLAEGEAAAMIEGARAFREQKILEAEGDALAFRLREREYRRAPDVTRFRLYLEALEEVLPSPQKILRPGGEDLKEFDLWLLDPPGARRGQ